MNDIVRLRQTYAPENYMNLKPPQLDPFFLLILDEDTNQFTIEGPMQDDTAWIRVVRGAQILGRAVRCFNPNTGAGEALVWGQTHGYAFVACGSIVGPIS